MTQPIHAYAAHVLKLFGPNRVVATMRPHETLDDFEARVAREVKERPLVIGRAEHGATIELAFLVD